MEIVGQATRRDTVGNAVTAAVVQLCDMLPANERVTGEAFDTISAAHPDMAHPSHGEHIGDQLVCSCGAIAMVGVRFRPGPHTPMPPLPTQRTSGAS